MLDIVVSPAIIVRGMRLISRAILVAALMLSSAMTGALNGRVLCVADGGHVAVEAAHAAGACGGQQSPADAPAHDPTAAGARVDHDPAPADPCVDIASSAELVRESPPTSGDVGPFQITCPFATAQPFSLAEAPCDGAADPRRADASPPPPGAGDLARLSLIVLTI